MKQLKFVGFGIGCSLFLMQSTPAFAVEVKSSEAHAKLCKTIPLKSKADFQDLADRFSKAGYSNTMCIHNSAYRPPKGGDDRRLLLKDEDPIAVKEFYFDKISGNDIFRIDVKLERGFVSDVQCNESEMTFPD